MNHIQALENEIAQLKEEFEKFERGNKSAGTRARKVLQNIKRISQEIRDHIQDVKKGEEETTEKS
jgi:exonuclease VII small subunit